MEKYNMNCITVNQISDLKSFYSKKIGIACGIFDGVHLGHQKIVKKLTNYCKKNNFEPIVLTMFPHPRSILTHQKSPLMLTSLEHKIEILQKLGINAVVVLPFSQKMADLSPEDFLKKHLMTDDEKISAICVGSNWRFGKNGKGNIETLKTISKHHNFDVLPVSELMLEGKKVSSTIIRKKIVTGELSVANKMLGRPFSVIGQVISGKHIATSVLNCPTANILGTNEIFPPRGVYAGNAFLNKQSQNETNKYPGIIYVGDVPTFSDPQHPPIFRLEIHFFDFNQNIYGKEIEVEFIKYIRPEMKFADSAKLKKQIQSDISEAKRLLKL
ncbi:MAG: bifunctional riboflavin kinase/FAD synthetase [Verrucomicrobiota bacterium]|nr:bifunctional riboflavin kinase/FAD synthetase [Verrucomicrobiota bacterium]